MILQKGNRKLPKSTLIFNLPAEKTCPMSTPECEKWCYAKKAERLYPQVLPFREKCYKLSLTEDFVATICDEIIKAKNCDTIRLHESGDIYNMKYFKKWIRIIKLFPEKIFYAYTKVKFAYMGVKPKNFILIKSDDKKQYKIKDLKQLGFNGRARVDDGRKLTKKEYLCPGSCKTCDYCYNGKGFKQIVFKKH